jgi:hypothetical protein
MDMDRLKTVAREAALLNIRYYSSLVELSRGYLNALQSMVEGAGAAPPDRIRPQAKEKAEVGSPVAPPLVLAARAGETATAEFSVSNRLGRQVAADVVVSGDLPLDRIRTEPEGKVLEPGEEAVFRIACAIDEAIELGSDRHGVVSVPGLATRSIPLVVRRLPDGAGNGGGAGAEAAGTPAARGGKAGPAATGKSERGRKRP